MREKHLHAILVDGTAYDWNNLMRVLFARMDYFVCLCVCHQHFAHAA